MEKNKTIWVPSCFPRIISGAKVRLAFPVAERLEARHLCSASVAISVFNDPNQSGAHTSPIAGRQVFADLDGSGVFKAGDPTAITNAEGVATLSLASAMTSSVKIGEILPKGVGQTTPAEDEPIVSTSATPSVSFGNLTLDDSPTATGLNYSAYAFSETSPLGTIFDAVTQPDGKILAVGQDSFSSSGGIQLSRFFPDGERDLNFGMEGIVGTSLSDFGGLTVESDGCIVLTGENANFVPTAVAFEPNGSPDSSFQWTASDTSTATRIAGISQTSDGSLLLSGMKNVQTGTGAGLPFLTLLDGTTGVPVTSFGAQGTLTYQSSATLLAAPAVVDPENNDIYLLLKAAIPFPTGSLSLLTISGSGSVMSNTPLSSNLANPVPTLVSASQTDFSVGALGMDGGKLVFSGPEMLTDTQGDLDYYLSVARVGLDGTPDTSFGGGTDVGGIPAAALQDLSPEVYYFSQTQSLAPGDEQVLPNGDILVTAEPEGSILNSSSNSPSAAYIALGYTSSGVPLSGFNTPTSVEIENDGGSDSMLVQESGVLPTVDGQSFSDTVITPPTMLAGTSLVDLSVEATGPTAVLTSSTSVSVAVSSDAKFQVTYTDPVSLQLDTIGTGNLQITTPSGATETATYMGIVSGTAQDLTVAYSVAPPVGGWSTADNGSYTVNLLADQVGNASVAAAAADLGSFSVDIPAASATAPTAALAAVPTITADTASVPLAVAYIGISAPISAATIGTADLSVTGPAGTLTVTAATPNPSTDATNMMVTYTVAGPAGGFTADDNGTYTISLAAGQVTDTSGDAAVPQTLGTFIVSIPPTATPAATALTVSVAAPSVQSGNLIDLTATAVTTTAAAAEPTGTVSFFTGGDLLGTTTLSDGTASFATAALPAGSNPVSAVFAGTSAYEAATSTAVIVTVIAPAGSAPALTPNLARAVPPATLVAGVKHAFAIPLTVMNTGAAVERGTVRVNVYASSGTTLDSSSVLLTGVPWKVSIKPGRSAGLSLHLTGVPSTLPAGTYHLLVQAIDVAGFAQTAATAKAITVASPVVSPVVTIAKTPKSIVTGAKTRAAVDVRIANAGNVPMTGVVTVTLYLGTDDTIADATAISDITFKANIAAGRSAVVAVPVREVPDLAAGLAYFFAVAKSPATNDGAAAASATSEPAAVEIVEPKIAKH